MAFRTAFESHGPQETESLGARVARRLVPGDVVLVVGEVGAGKTTFIRGAARALGVDGPVTSPTFSIAHRYRGEDVTVSHLDLYRIDDLSGEDPDLLHDYLGPDRIAFVEWPRGHLMESEDLRATVLLRDPGEGRDDAGPDRGGEIGVHGLRPGGGGSDRDGEIGARRVPPGDGDDHRERQAYGVEETRIVDVEWAGGSPDPEALTAGDAIGGDPLPLPGGRR